MSTMTKEPLAQVFPRPAGPAGPAGPPPLPGQPPAQRSLHEPSLVRAAVGGSVAACVCAGAWTVITMMTGYQSGLMALGVGLVVGITVRVTGGGNEPVFGYVGAGLSVAGCLLGNLLAGLAVASSVDAETSSLLGGIVSEMFDPISLLFYVIAMVEGYKLALQPKSKT